MEKATCLGMDVVVAQTDSSGSVQGNIVRVSVEGELVWAERQAWQIDDTADTLMIMVQHEWI